MEFCLSFKMAESKQKSQEGRPKLPVQMVLNIIPSLGLEKGLGG